MSKKKRNDGDKIPYTEWTWVIDNLTSAQLKKHDESPRSPKDILDAIEVAIDDGAQFTLKHDSYNNCYMVSMVFAVAGVSNSGYALSSRGNDVTDALSILFYKYLVVADRHLSDIADETRNVRG